MIAEFENGTISTMQFSCLFLFLLSWVTLSPGLRSREEAGPPKVGLRKPILKIPGEPKSTGFLLDLGRVSNFV